MSGTKLIVCLVIMAEKLTRFPLDIRWTQWISPFVVWYHTLTWHIYFFTTLGFYCSEWIKCVCSLLYLQPCANLSTSLQIPHFHLFNSFLWMRLWYASCFLLLSQKFDYLWVSPLTYMFWGLCVWFIHNVFWRKVFICTVKCRLMCSENIFFHSLSWPCWLPY